MRHAPFAQRKGRERAKRCERGMPGEGWRHPLSRHSYLTTLGLDEDEVESDQGGPKGHAE